MSNSLSNFLLTTRDTKDVQIFPKPVWKRNRGPSKSRQIKNKVVKGLEVREKRPKIQILLLVTSITSVVVLKSAHSLVIQLHKVQYNGHFEKNKTEKQCISHIQHQKRGKNKSIYYIYISKRHGTLTSINIQRCKSCLYTCVMFPSPRFWGIPQYEMTRGKNGTALYNTWGGKGCSG